MSLSDKNPSDKNKILVLLSLECEPYTIKVEYNSSYDTNKLTEIIFNKYNVDSSTHNIELYFEDDGIILSNKTFDELGVVDGSCMEACVKRKGLTNKEAIIDNFLHYMFDGLSPKSNPL